MKDFTVFDVAGRALRTGYCPESMVDAQAQIGEVVMSALYDGATEYWNGNSVEPRPKLTLTADKSTVVANGTDQVTVSGVPAGATVTVAGPSETTGNSDGADLVLTFAIAGAYQVQVAHFPYQDEQVTIHAI